MKTDSYNEMIKLLDTGGEYTKFPYSTSDALNIIVRLLGNVTGANLPIDYVSTIKENTLGSTLSVWTVLPHNGVVTEHVDVLGIDTGASTLSVIYTGEELARFDATVSGSLSVTGTHFLGEGVGLRIKNITTGEILTGSEKFFTTGSGQDILGFTLKGYGEVNNGETLVVEGFCDNASVEIVLNQVVINAREILI